MTDKTTPSPGKPDFPLWATVTAAGSDQWSAAASCANAMLKGLEAWQKAHERATREVTERQPQLRRPRRTPPCPLTRRGHQVKRPTAASAVEHAEHIRA